MDNVQSVEGKEGEGVCLKCNLQTQPKMLCKCPERQADGSWKEVVAEKLEKVDHKNIYFALAAFQGENPKIARTKHVDYGTSKGDKVDYWYAPLDEILQTIRPLTSRHGLAIAWEALKDGQMVCALYHETYERTSEKVSVFSREGGTTEEELKTTPRALEREELVFVEKNVIRSMPIKVKRDGDMKQIGTDSTYARRYTLAEVLGIAPDEDNDTKIEEERLEKVEGFAFKQAMNRVENAKSLKTLAEQVVFFNKELETIGAGKASSLGFKKEQYEELLAVADMKKTHLEDNAGGGSGENGGGGTGEDGAK